MKKHILAVDESRAIRFLIQTIFKSNYRVTTAPDGLSAMYFLSQGNNPDIIIVDPELPDMPNWELVKNLQSSGLYGDIPVVVLTNGISEEIKDKCEKYGIKVSFVKPFNPVRLAEEVKQILAAASISEMAKN